MPLISSLGLDDVYKHLKGQFREVRAASVRLRTAATAGSINFTTVRDYYENLYSNIVFCDTAIAKFGANVLQSYAREQEDSATYTPSTEYVAMKNAATAVLNHIATVLPANSTHTVSNGTVNEPTFSTTQTTTLRNLLDTLIGTIGAP